MISPPLSRVPCPLNVNYHAYITERAMERWPNIQVKTPTTQSLWSHSLQGCCGCRMSLYPGKVGETLSAHAIYGLFLSAGIFNAGSHPRTRQLPPKLRSALTHCVLQASVGCLVRGQVQFFQPLINWPLGGVFLANPAQKAAGLLSYTAWLYNLVTYGWIIG